LYIYLDIVATAADGSELAEFLLVGARRRCGFAEV